MSRIALSADIRYSDEAMFFYKYEINISGSILIVNVDVLSINMENVCDLQGQSKEKEHDPVILSH